MANPTTFGKYTVALTMGALAGGTQSTIGQATSGMFGSYQTLAGGQAAQVKAGGAVKMDEALLNAKLEAVEARTDNKFSQLLGELKVISANVVNLDSKIVSLDQKVGEIDKHTRSTKTAIISTVIGTGIAVAALSWVGIQLFQGGVTIGMSAQPRPSPSASAS